jgi:putative membrane protein
MGRLPSLALIAFLASARRKGGHLAVDGGIVVDEEETSMISSKRTGMKLAGFAGGVLLCGASALGQSMPGSMQPQNPATAQQPGMNQSPSTMAPMNPGMNGMANGQPTPADKMFVKKALEGGMAEVQLGQLALQKSNNDDVKQFAQRMVDDHTKMGEQMKPIAQQIGVTIPDAPSKKDQATLARLQTLSGADFDKAYMKDMVKDHKADLNDFKTEAQSGSSPAVKDAASKGSKVISEHLQLAEQINQKASTMASNGGMK